MSNKERPSNDHYPTPPEFVRALFSVESFCGSIWEPCCGRGEMLYEIHNLAARGVVIGTTIDNPTHLIDLGAKHIRGMEMRSPFGNIFYAGQDFLKETSCTIDNIITNPPYSIVDDIVEHALSLNVKGKVAMLLNAKWDSGLKRYERILKHNPPSRIWSFVDRLAMYPKEHVGKKGSPTENYAWFVWDKSHMGATNKGWLKLRDFKDDRI